MESVKFNGKWISLPWSGWEGIQISPAGIKTTNGDISINELTVLLWKIRVYGERRAVSAASSQGART